MNPCPECGGKVVVHLFTSVECETPNCPNFSPSLKDTAPPPHTDADYSGWEYDETLGLWYKHETY